VAVPTTQNLTITRGDTESLVINMDDGTGAINITGRTYRSQIRQTKDSTIIAASFTCVITNAAAGQVTCTLSAASTALLSPGIYYWDFEETNGGAVSTILAGSVNVLADVTR
jgi:hypothetical protein